MAKTINELKSAAAVVRDATEDRENTALRVGQLLFDTIDVVGDIQDTLTFDSTPTTGSTNPVTSGGVAAAIAAEATARAAADSSLQSAIAAEATARAAADTSLQSAIAAEATARESADSSLQSAIAAEATAREAADALKADAAEVDAQMALCGIVTESYDKDSYADGTSTAGIPGKFYSGYGFYIYAVDTQVGALQAYEGYGCIRILVKAGDIVVISTLGGKNFRAYALTDTNRYVLTRSEQDEDTTANPVTLEVEQDGYLYANCKSSAFAEFGIELHRHEDATVDALVEEVAEISTAVGTLDKEVGDAVTYGVKDLDFNDEDPDHGMIWALNVDVGGRVTNPIRSVSTAWGCLRLLVKAGDTVTVNTIGQKNNYRGWALTDANSYVLAHADDNETVSLVSDTIKVTQEGRLYINCKVEGATPFSVRVTQQIKDRVAALEADALVAPSYHNNPLPLWKDSLRVLAIGNSFIKDSLSYLSDLVAAAGIDASKLCIYGIVYGGSNPQTFVDYYNNNTDVADNVARWAGSLTISIGKHATLAQVFAHEWDVVVINGFSKWAWEDYGSSISELVKAVRSSCPNQQVALAWHQVWSYASYENTGYVNSDAQWKALCDATKSQMHYIGIDIVIPTGTAVQNARKTTIAAGHWGKASDDPNRAGELTRDGAHICFGAGRYLAACTWFQSLLSPMFNVCVVGNSAVHICTLSEHLWRDVFTKQTDTAGKNPSSEGWCERRTEPEHSEWDANHPEWEWYYKLSIDTSVKSGTDYYKHTTEGGDDGDKGADTNETIDVDATNNEILQRCALAACVDMWSITDDIDPIQEQQE